MSDEKTTQNKQLLLPAIWTALGVVSTTLVGWLAGPSEVLSVPAKPATAIAGALSGIIAALSAWTWHLWKQSSDSRVRLRFEHDVATGISVEIGGPHIGRKICSKCLLETPARVCPLYDAYGHGAWVCHHCGRSFSDAGRLARDKEHSEEERKKPKRDRTYDA